MEFTKEEMEAAGLDDTELDALNEVPDENYVQTDAEPEPTAKVAPEPEPAAKVDPEPEPEVKADPEPEPAAKVDPEPESTAKVEEPEPVVKADLEPAEPAEEPWFAANRDVVNRPVENAAGKELQRLDGEIQGLHDQFDAGDLERREYDDKVAKAREDRGDVKRHLDNNKDRNAEYCDALDSFFAKPENVVFKDQNLFSMLDAQVRNIAQAGPQKSDAQVLREARQYLVDMEVKGLATWQPAPEAPKPGKPAAKAPDHVEKTLTDVPAAAPESTGGKSPFAHLDRLDGDALENKLANMTEADRGAWLDETAP